MSHTQGHSFDSDNHSPVAEWFIQNRKTVITSIVLAIVAISFCVWWISHRKNQEIRDFEQAEILAQDLQNPDIAIRSETLSELKAINDRYPILNRRYDGILAQEFIIEKDTSSVDPYAKRASTQLASVDLNHFAQFSEVSRLIALEDLQGALDTAVKLQAAVEASGLTAHNFGLLAFTTLDIALLNQKLGKIDERNKALTKVAELLVLSTSSDPSIQEAAESIRGILQENNSSLLDYLQQLKQ